MFDLFLRNLSYLNKFINYYKFYQIWVQQRIANTAWMITLIVYWRDWIPGENMILNLDNNSCKFFTLKKNKSFLLNLFNSWEEIAAGNITYLSCRLDSRVNWTEQAIFIKERAERELLILKPMGWKREILLNIFKNFINHYSTSELISHSFFQCNRNSRNLHNQALRLIAGAVKSTPITAMQALTNLTPVKHRIYRKAKILLYKLRRPPNIDFWRNYKFKGKLKLISIKLLIKLRKPWT